MTPLLSRSGMVPPRYERAAEAVPGPFYVYSENCIICALPPETAPANIQFLPNPARPSCPRYCYVHKQPGTEEELDQMISAMAGSCVEAIRYCGTDPYILKRLREVGMEHLCDAL